MSDLARILGAFSEAYGCGAVLWVQPAGSEGLEVAATSGGFQIEDITSNDVMLSVRMALGSQPAPMPVAFK